MKNIENYREQVITDLRGTATFRDAWTIWGPQVAQLTDDWSDAQAIFNLGSRLTDLFTSTSVDGRGQRTLSAAGHAWEGLVCWYLNAVFCGSRAVAVKHKKSLIPSCISDAATINYGSDQTNTESDIVIILFPEEFDFADCSTIEALSEKMAGQLNRFEVGIIQCKTNWNDNAQIPMLWDMIYRAEGFKANSITIGRNGHRIGNLNNFTYSFVTVPSQKDEYKPTSMSVKRVRNLSGGNYWGKPTQNGVALSLCEIFNRNFGAAFDEQIVQNMRSSLLIGRGIFL